MGKTLPNVMFINVHPPTYRGSGFLILVASLLLVAMPGAPSTGAAASSKNNINLIWMRATCHVLVLLAFLAKCLSHALDLRLDVMNPI